MKLQFPLPKDARLVFGVWDFSGAWMLVLGVSPSHVLSPGTG